MSRSPTTPDVRRRRRTALRDVAYHALVYVFVGSLLVVLDVRAGQESGAVLGLDWAFWVLLFWGFGLAAHLVSAVFADLDQD